MKRTVAAFLQRVGFVDISRQSRIVAGGLAKIAFVTREGRIAAHLLHERIQEWPALEWSLES